MKKTLGWLLVCLLPFSVVIASPQEEANAILKTFVAIEKSKNELNIKNKTLSDGTMISFWSNKSQLKKLVIQSKDEFGKTADHYYFESGALILCRSIHDYYPLDAKGQQSSELKTDKHFLLYKQAELIKPNADAPSNQAYVDLGIEKRNTLINYLTKVSR